MMLKRKNYLNYNLPYITKDEINEVVDTLRSGWLTTGPKTKLFENNFKDYVGSRHAVALNSGTAALHLALIASGVGPGDEVITTPYTFASTILTIMHVGAKPVFVDIREDTFNMNDNYIEGKVTGKTKAILPVHFGGIPCEMKIISKIAKKHKLFVIEDAAHAVGSEYEGVKVGNIGDITAFSFYATKNLSTGEGGMATTNSGALADKMRILSLHGISKDSFKRYAKGGSWSYEVLEQGYKYNMADIQAALGIHQLKKLDKMNARREKIALKLNTIFQNNDSLIPYSLPKNIKNSWHLYVLQLNNKSLKISRAMFIEELKKMNIGTSVHFIPVSWHPYFKKELGIKPGTFPVSDKVYRRVISLPLYPSLSDYDTDYVAESVMNIIKKFKK